MVINTLVPFYLEPFVYRDYGANDVLFIQFCQIFYSLFE